MSTTTTVTTTTAAINGDLASEAIIASHSIPKALRDELDPEWVKLWNDHGRYKMRADEVSVEEYRKDPAAYSFTYAAWAGPDVHHVRDVQVPVHRPEGEVTVRVYTPEGPGPFPVHFNMHGGGWVLGGLQSEAAWCRSVCTKAGVVVIDIDYRMAPEYVFPTAIYDCWDTIAYFRANAHNFNLDPTSVSIGGLSAGGHMSAVLSHMARNEGVHLKLALLVVPSVDLRWAIGTASEQADIAKLYPSIALVEKNPWGPRSRMDWFMRYWIPDTPGVRRAAMEDWMASPILADSFADLPRTHIVTAEFDLSRDESHQYGEKLRQAGCEVTMKCYSGMPHAFGHYNHPERGLKKSHEYLEDTCEVIRAAHGRWIERLCRN